MWQFLRQNSFLSRINLVIKFPKKTGIFLFFLLSISGINSLRNGEIVEKGHFCYVVSIWITRPIEFIHDWYEFRCSGVILSQSHILTAGHCVYDVSRYNMEIRASAYGCTPLHYSHNYVEAIMVHPDFQKIVQVEKPMTDYWMHDIAVLKLVCELPLGSTLAAIPLDRHIIFPYGTENCFFAGWNRIITNTTLHLALNQAEVKVLRNQIFYSDSFLLPNEMYGFLTASRALIDETDDGNALICDGKVVGIIVGGRDRTRSVISLLTTTSYRQFINAVMSDNYDELNY